MNSIGEMPPRMTISEIFKNAQTIQEDFNKQSRELNKNIEYLKHKSDEKIKEILSKYAPKNDSDFVEHEEG